MRRYHEVTITPGDGTDQYTELSEHKSGEWVKYSEAKELEAQNTKYREALEDIVKEIVADLTDCDIGRGCGYIAQEALK